jgi:hypothetical protein
VSTEEKIVFCEMEAWHSFDRDRRKHEFVCDGTHRNFSEFEICFLIDVTGSMAEYIRQAREVVNKIINSPMVLEKQIGVKFAVVGYRDHKMSESPLFVRFKELCIRKRRMIEEEPLEEFLSFRMTK